MTVQGGDGGEVAVDDGTRQIVQRATVGDGRLIVDIAGATGHLNALTLTPLP